jgi:hypothetical protein
MVARCIAMLLVYYVNFRFRPVAYYSMQMERIFREKLSELPDVSMSIVQAANHDCMTFFENANIANKV